jgi:hypothetical protein
MAPEQRLELEFECGGRHFRYFFACTRFLQGQGPDVNPGRTQVLPAQA